MNAIAALLAHIDRLRAIHKANLATAPGDLDQLWDLAADVRSACATAAIGPIAGDALRYGPVERVRLVAEVLDPQGDVARRIPVEAGSTN